MKTFKNLLLAGLVFLSGTLAAKDPGAVALDGYCPVCYLAAGKAVKGTSQFKADHKGQTYYFVKQEALDAFKKEPEKFLPAYGGLCAYGMALGKKIESDPTVFTVVDGKIYLNKNKAIGAKFSKDTASFITKADAEWKKVEMAMEKEKNG